MSTTSITNPITETITNLPTSQEALQLIPLLAKSASYHNSRHAMQRLTQPDRCFTHDKLLTIISYPKTVSEPTYNHKHNSFTYKIMGYNKRHVVVSFQNNNTEMIIVTVF